MTEEIINQNKFDLELWERDGDILANLSNEYRRTKNKKLGEFLDKEIPKFLNEGIQIQMNGFIEKNGTLKK